MGTRHLTIVKIDDKIKVAQYGQWYGYPTGQGQTIADFFNKAIPSDEDRNLFKEKVKKLEWISDVEYDEIFQQLGANKYMTIAYPQFSRDTGAGILHYIMYNNIEFLCNSIDFITDSIFCEWAYEINLDTDKITIFRNGNNVFAEFNINDFTSELMEELETNL